LVDKLNGIIARHYPGALAADEGVPVRCLSQVSQRKPDDNGILDGIPERRKKEKART
jgi:hypothetical protein